MILCKFKTDGLGWQQIGAVSHCFHGVVTSGGGLQWCRLEVFRTFGKNEAEKAFSAMVPGHGEIVNDLHLCTDNAYANAILNLQHIAAGWNLKLDRPHYLNRQYAAGNWLRAVHLAFEFTPAEVPAPAFGLGRGLECALLPANAAGALTAAACEHGNRVALGGRPPITAADFVHDFDDFQAGHHIVRIEKESCQRNSLMQWALANEMSARGGVAALETVNRWTPKNPGSVAGRANNAALNYQGYNLTLGGPANNLAFIHFMEVSGLFKHLSLPALSELETLNHPLLGDKSYLRHQFDSVLEGDIPNLGGDDIPHEIVTLISTAGVMF